MIQWVMLNMKSVSVVCVKQKLNLLQKITYTCICEKPQAIAPGSSQFVAVW